MRRVFSQTVKRASSLMAALILLAQMAIPVTVGATPSGKVVICHATDSHNNPYTTNDINTSSVDEDNNQYLNNGHGDHDGPVWESGIADHSWGDIIPPFTNPLTGTSFPGQNWTSQGQAIWNNGCKVPGTNQTDYCDPSQYNIVTDKDKLTVEERADCFTITPSLKCGEFNITVAGPTYGVGGFRAVYTLDGTSNNYKNFPVSFDEDEGGGSVEVTWFLVGPESNWFVTDGGVSHGTDIPNFWEGNFATQIVKTDCEKPKGELTLVKKVINNNDGTATQDDFVPTLNGNETTWGTHELPIGTYTVDEIMKVSGYKQTDLRCYKSYYKFKTVSHPVNLKKGDKITCKVTNDDDKPKVGKVKVNKKVDINGDGIYLGGNITANALGFDWGLDTDTPARNMGSSAFNVPVGPHTVTEEGPSDYTFTGWYYTNQEKNFGRDKVNCKYPQGTDYPVSINVEKNKITEITLCNQKVKDNGGGGGQPKTGKITGHKFNDANGNVQMDDDEEKLSGWTIELSRCNDVQLNVSLFANLKTPVTGNGTPTLKNCNDLELLDTTVTDENGHYSFTGLENGVYWVCEVQKDGWVQTYPGKDMCWEVNVDDEECIVDFGNKAKTPGEVLGEQTPTPQVLANTGSSFSYGIIVALSIIGTAAAVVTRRQHETSNSV